MTTTYHPLTEPRETIDAEFDGHVYKLRLERGASGGDVVEYRSFAYDVSGNWPAQEPWGAGADLYRVLDFYNSAYIEPIGALTKAHTSRWRRSSTTIPTRGHFPR